MSRFHTTHNAAYLIVSLSVYIVINRNIINNTVISVACYKYRPIVHYRRIIAMMMMTRKTLRTAIIIWMSSGC